MPRSKALGIVATIYQPPYMRPRSTLSASGRECGEAARADGVRDAAAIASPRSRLGRRTLNRDLSTAGHLSQQGQSDGGHRADAGREGRLGVGLEVAVV